MPVLIKLPKPKHNELVNHLLTEQSGVGALDAKQGKVLSDRLNTLETITIRDLNYNDTQAVNMLHDYWNQLKIGTYTVLLITSGGTWRANIYKHSDPYGDYILSSYFRLDTTYKAPLIGKILNGQWFDYGELALTSSIRRKEYTMTVGGNLNTFYPVSFSGRSQYTNIIELTKHFNTPTLNSGGLRAKIEYGLPAWGGYPSFIKIHHYLKTTNFIADVKMENESVNTLIVWLRGDTQYNVIDNLNTIPPVICYERTNLSKNPSYPFYVEPRTTIAEEFKHSIHPVQSQFLATPLQGTVLTNNIPPSVNTRVNQLMLQPGTYLITSHVAYRESFPNTVVHWLLNGDGGQLIINRGTADGGGGTTPVMIYQVTKPISIYSCIYQSSNIDRTIDRNTLTALRMA